MQTSKNPVLDIRGRTLACVANQIFLTKVDTDNYNDRQANHPSHVSETFKYMGWKLIR